MEKSSEAVAHVLVSEGRKATQFTQSKKVTFFKKMDFLMTWKIKTLYVVVTARLSRILIGKQKLGVTFNSDKQDDIDFMKFSKMTMCRALEVNT